MGNYLLRGALVGAVLTGAIVLALQIPDQIRNGGMAKASPAAQALDKNSKSAAGSSQAGTSQEAPAIVETIAPLPANATSVPDDNILILARFVDLPNSAEHHPDKARWKQAMVAAQKLAQGPCDCEQRNWLNHFIEMGEFALSDSDSKYRESAKLMATLGRNDTHAMAISHRP